MSEVIDPNDMKFYEQEARNYFAQIEEYCTREFILSTPHLITFRSEQEKLQLLLLCGNYKKAVDVGNKIINKYFMRPLLGDLCER